MNTQELLNTLKIVGATLFGILAMHGYMSPQQASDIMSSLTVAVPALLSLGTIGMSIYSHWNMKKVPEAAVAIEPHAIIGRPIVGYTVSLPPAAKVVGALLAAFILSAFLAVPEAQAQTRRPTLTGNPVADVKSAFEKTTGVKATGDVPFDLLKALDKALLPDLKYAQKLATATGSKVTAPCYQAWIDMIQTQQTAVVDPPVPPATDATPTAEPDPDLVTKFERMVELRNALQPDSPFMTACSPVANMVKLDVTAFMGIVISGGAGLATLVPGL